MVLSAGIEHTLQAPHASELENLLFTGKVMVCDYERIYVSFVYYVNQDTGENGQWESKY